MGRNRRKNQLKNFGISSKQAKALRGLATKTLRVLTGEERLEIDVVYKPAKYIATLFCSDEEELARMNLALDTDQRDCSTRSASAFGAGD